MRPQSKAYLLLVAVFLLGGVAGAALDHSYVARGSGALPDEDREHEGRLRALAHALDLSAEQRRSIRRIMATRRREGRQVMQHTMEVCGEALRAYKAETDAQIRNLLTPEQQPRFDALLVRQRERFPLGWPGRAGRAGRDHGPDR
jgi:Spy/CpxP family protein refolding chaperone